MVELVPAEGADEHMLRRSGLRTHSFACAPSIPPWPEMTWPGGCGFTETMPGMGSSWQLDTSLLSLLASQRCICLAYVRRQGNYAGKRMSLSSASQQYKLRYCHAKRVTFLSSVGRFPTQLPKRHAVRTEDSIVLWLDITQNLYASFQSHIYFLRFWSYFSGLC
jgi:hypothetical protein